MSDSSKTHSDDDIDNLSSEQRSPHRSQAREPSGNYQTPNPHGSYQTPNPHGIYQTPNPPGNYQMNVGSYESSESSLQSADLPSEDSSGSSSLSPEQQRQHRIQTRSPAGSHKEGGPPSGPFEYVQRSADSYNTPLEHQRQQRSQVGGLSGSPLEPSDYDQSSSASEHQYRGPPVKQNLPGSPLGASDYDQSSSASERQYRGPPVKQNLTGSPLELDASDYDQSSASDYMTPAQQRQHKSQAKGPPIVLFDSAFERDMQVRETGKVESSIEPSDFDDSSFSHYMSPPQRHPVVPSPPQSTEKSPDQQVLQPKKKPFYRRLKSKMQQIFQPGATTSAQPTHAEADVLYKFEVDYVPLDRLMRQPTNVVLQYLQDNYRKISQYDYLAWKVAELLMEFGPKGTIVDPLWNPGNILQVMRKILQNAEKKWAMFDLSMKELGLLKSSKVAAKILQSKDRISEVLEALYQRAYEAEENFNGLLFEKLALEEMTESLKTELESLYDILERGGKPVPYLHKDAGQFIKDLEKQLAMRENLNSSLNEQLRKERQRNKELHIQARRAEEIIVNEQESYMESFSEAAQEFEVKEGIKEAIIKRIQGLTANKDEVRRAVNDWMRVTSEVLEEKQQPISEMERRIKALEEMLVERQVIVTTLTELLEEKTREADEVKETAKYEDKRLKRWAKALEKTFETQEYYERKILDEIQLTNSLQDHYYSARSSQSAGDPSSPGPSGQKVIVQSPHMHRWPVKRRQPGEEIPVNKMDRIEEDESPEQFRRGSPDYFSTYPREFDPISLESTPSSRASPATSAPSPFDLPMSSPDLPSYCGTVAPGTQTLSRPRSALDPASRNLSGVMNHIDVGKSFNMQTVHRDTSTPYRQVTRVASLIPEAGPSRMSESPLHIMHRAQLTPDDYVTPFIPSSRFGYTDPTARVLNIPPGPQFVHSGIRKTVVLANSRRQEPLLVNIDVDPKPLMEGPTGEQHFICDISLDLQQAGRLQQRYLPPADDGPVHTYDEPPAVTPTSARRYGSTTPTGIFKKDHFNIRRVYWPDEYQSPNLPWSPHDLPDARTPISSFGRSPFDKSLSPVIKGPRYRRTSPDWMSPESDESASLGIRTPGLGASYDASPRAASGALNKTFDKSMSPVIKGPRYGEMSPETETDESASLGIRTPGLGASYDASPRAALGTLNKTFDKSMSPVIKGPRYGRMSPASDTTEFNETFDSHGSPQDEYYSHREYQDYQSHNAPSLNKTYDKSSTPSYGSTSTSGSNGSYRQAAASRLDGTYDRSAFSSQTGSSQGRSASSQHSRTTDQSMSPKMNATFSKSQSPQSNGTYDEYDDRGTSRMNRTFNVSPSSQSDRADEDSPLNRGYRDTSSLMNRTFDKGGFF